MITKLEVIDEARKCGFDHIGFTTADPFESQREILSDRHEKYSWTSTKFMDLMQSTDPRKVFPEARSIIVLVEPYFRNAVPASLVGKFGRVYIDDDRMTKDGLQLRVKAFRSFLRKNGIESKLPAYIPHRLAAARAGLGTFGKNNLFYSNKAARQSSWIYIFAILVDKEFEPDEPTIEVGCPKWCKNTCIVACPTGALIAPGHIDPNKCISFHTYYEEGITPLKLREPMGMRIYGCDRCQEVCPRNEAWLAQELPENQTVKRRASDFELTRLLHMDTEYFEKRIWPHMFYIPVEEVWRWKMNAARVMGNSRDPVYIPHLVRAMTENKDERVTGMAAWAIGRIGGIDAEETLSSMLKHHLGSTKEEILHALDGLK